MSCTIFSSHSQNVVGLSHTKTFNAIIIHADDTLPR